LQLEIPAPLNTLLKQEGLQLADAYTSEVSLVPPTVCNPSTSIGVEDMDPSHPQLTSAGGIAFGHDTICPDPRLPMWRSKKG